MFCGKCGTKLKEGAAFCPECGNPVRGIPEVPVRKADPDATVKVRPAAYPESLRKAPPRTPSVTPPQKAPVRTAPEAPAKKLSVTSLEKPSAGTVPQKPEKLISTMDSAVDPGQQEIFEKNFKPLGDL